MRLTSLSLILAAVIGTAISLPARAEPVSFVSSDGVRVFGDFEQSVGNPRGTILLFHMAGSNLAEYQPLSPVLNKAGFSTLAVDQRSGGDLWGRANRTMAGLHSEASYADALGNLDTALAYAKSKHSGPILIWGSSYSSALVFILAAHHTEVRALLAFSPAEYIPGHSIRDEAARLSIPAFITSAPDGDEIASAEALAKAVPGNKAVLYVPQQGVHGSATLRVDQNPQGAAENWQHVLSFLDAAFPR